MLLNPPPEPHAGGASSPPGLLPIARAWSPGEAAPVFRDACCAEPDGGAAPAALGARLRLADLDPHLHCSVIGTCCSTAELRKLLAKFIDVQGLDELLLHHEAVRLATQGGEPAKAMHKLLDRRHEATLQRYARARDEASVLALWKDSLKAGEVPGAYWAVLTHRRATEPLRQRAFGDVHMLSHLVGAANRADIRRLQELERENEALRERVDRAQERHAEVVQERDAALQSLNEARAAGAPGCRAPARPSHPRVKALEQRVQHLEKTLHDEAERRHSLELSARVSRLEALRLSEELQQLGAHADELARELAATEQHMRALSDETPSPDSLALQRLRGQRLLYVGGRPSSTPAIRALVESAGGEFRRHDGGIEDRKGTLGASLAWADLVVFPVDCVDHDSALALKRDCKRHERPFLALRSASVTSLVGALTRHDAIDDPSAPALRCLRHA